MITLTGGAFTDPKGTAVALGKLRLELSQDAKVAAGNGQIAPLMVDIALNVSGSITTNTAIYGNDELTPSGTYYRATVYDANNGRVYGPQLWQLNGGGTLNVGSITPVSVAGPSVSTAILDHLYFSAANNDVGMSRTAADVLSMDSGDSFQADKLLAKGSPWFDVKAYGAVGDGSTDDTTAINSAITAASAAGGIVFIPAGTFISSQVVMKSNVWLRGAGRNVTTLKLKAASNQSLVVLSAATTQDTLLTDLTLEGNATNQSAGNWHGLNYDNTGQVTLRRNTVERVYATHCKGDGFHFEAGFSGEGPQTDLIAYFNDRHGIYVGIPDLFFTNIDVGQSGKQGINIATGNVHFTASKSWFSGRLDTANGEGFYSTGNRTQITGAEAQDNAGAGFSFLNTTEVTAVGLVADSNGTGSTAAGIKLDGVTNSTIVGTTFDRNGSPVQAYGIQFANTNTSNTVILSSKNQLTSDTNGTIASSNALILNGSVKSVASLFIGTNPAQTALLNLPNNSALTSRNNANNNDIPLIKGRTDDGVEVGNGYITAFSTQVTGGTNLTRSLGASGTRWTTIFGQALDLSGATIDSGGKETLNGGLVINNIAAPSAAANQVAFGSTTASTVGAAGGASALPATPSGYLIINVAGTNFKLPYYAN